MPNYYTMTKKETVSMRCEIPKDVYKILIRQQAKEKEKRDIGQFSLELTMYTIIRRWDKGITKESED